MPSDLSLGQQFAHLHRVPEGRLMLQASPLVVLRYSLAEYWNLYPAINRWAIISCPSGTKYIGVVLCDTTASRYPFSCLPSTCVEQPGQRPRLR